MALQLLFTIFFQYLTPQYVHFIYLMCAVVNVCTVMINTFFRCSTVWTSRLCKNIISSCSCTCFECHIPLCLCCWPLLTICGRCWEEYWWTVPSS